MPAGRAYPLDALMEAIFHHCKKLKSKVLIEYVLLGNVNDTDVCAHELGQLLKSGEGDFTVNLIPYNPTEVPEGYLGNSEGTTVGDGKVYAYDVPDPRQVESFRSIVASYGHLTTVRQHHGRDIDGACGQLALKAGEKPGPVDIEDLCKPDVKEAPEKSPLAKEKPKKKKPMSVGFLFLLLSLFAMVLSMILGGGFGHTHHH